MTGDSVGSTATTLSAGFLDLRNLPAPMTVPAVPTPDTKMSILPPVCAQISGPVVRKCIAGLASFPNWSRFTAPGFLRSSSFIFATAPPAPLAGSVSTSSAPVRPPGVSARRRSPGPLGVRCRQGVGGQGAPKLRMAMRRSSEAEAGMVKIVL